MTVNSLKVSVSGVRGIVGESLTPDLICSFAAAFGEYVGRGRVIVGRDTRPTGHMYEQAVIAGLLSVGCQPVLIGIVPTPTVQIAVDEFKANGGIAITASHNPNEWNALKFINGQGLFLDSNEARELLAVYNQPDRQFVSETEYRNVRTKKHTFAIQQRRIFSLLNVEVIKKARLKVAVDCCNGAGALYSEKFLKDLGCEVIALNSETDGIFRRKPEPIAPNLTELCKAVVDNNCDIGFAQDPDADRIVVIDKNGNAIGEQYSVVLAAEHILSKTPGTVAVNIQTTKSLCDVAAKYNSTVIHTKVGEINVTSTMLQEQSVIGGEGGSGGVIWPAMHPCRDSYTGMALILEMMAERTMSINAILDTIPHYYQCQLKVQCSAEAAQRAIRYLIHQYNDLNPKTIDGLRLDYTDSWILIRPSNTEPIIRIYAEASTQDAADALARKFEKEIGSL